MFGMKDWINLETTNQENEDKILFVKRSSLRIILYTRYVLPVYL